MILGNSTSYGLHLIANGIRWEEGDEILQVEEDFPTDITPWLGLRKEGVNVKFIKPGSHVPSSEELVDAITDRTRLICTTWVNSFTGHLIDVDEVGGICHERDVKFVVNGTQAIGAKTLNLKETRVDAVTSCGFKWLCGPYGTGFCWIEPALISQLEYNQAYWLTLQEGTGLWDEMNISIDGYLGAKRYDVFGTANFHNFIPWTASVEYLLSKGIPSIEEHNEKLVKHLVKNIDSRKFEVISPEAGEVMSSIAVIDNLKGNNQDIYARLLDNGYYVSLRKGRLRISPHLYNTMDEIDAVLDLLRSCT